jgi:uncharacterized membrane protein YdfJ with MMPL/SSD domain
MPNQNFEKKVEAAMNSLDGIQKVGPKPFFFTRLQARMAAGENSGWEKISSFLARPAIAFSVISCVVLINSWAFFNYSSTTNNSKSISQQTEQLTTDEFGLASNNYYTDENP